MPVCILRSNPGGRAMKCGLSERCCVGLPPTLKGDAQRPIARFWPLRHAHRFIEASYGAREFQPRECLPHGRARQRPRSGSNRTKSDKSADLELVIAPQVDHRKVQRCKSCYLHHKRHHFKARAQQRNRWVLVCILRSNPGGRAMKCGLSERCCVG